MYAAGIKSKGLSIAEIADYYQALSREYYQRILILEKQLSDTSPQSNNCERKDIIEPTPPYPED